jgi:dihydrofolate reductase
VLDFARQWQAAEKVVYFRTLREPHSERTRIEREFNPHTIRQLKNNADHDFTVGGPELAASALRAGLVDEVQVIISPAVVGGGKPFFPNGVRLELDLIEERGFGNVVVTLRYPVRMPDRQPRGALRPPPTGVGKVKA